MTSVVRIKKGSPRQRVSRTKANQVETAFRVDNVRTLNVKAHHWEKRALHHLVQKIIRNPNNLHAHIQRINLNCTLNNSKGVFGALIDLYIALGEDGYDLRSRLVKKCKNYLSASEYLKLWKYNNKGLISSNTETSYTDSFLSKGFIGTSEIIKISINSQDSIKGLP